MTWARSQGQSTRTESWLCRNRTAIGLVLFVSIVGLVCRAQNDIRELGDFSSILNRAEKAIVFVEGFGDENEGASYASSVRSGTGCLISSSGTVLTTLHTVYGAESIMCTVAGTEYEYRILRTADSADVAVLEPAIALPFVVSFLRVDTTLQIKQLDEFLVVGFPLPDVLHSDAPVYAIGSVAAVRPRMSPDAIQMNLELEGGMSGAPIINRVGDIVGIIRSELSETSFGFGVPATDFAEILDPESKSLSASPFDPALGLGVTYINGLGPRVTWQMSLHRALGMQIGAAIGRDQVGWLSGDGTAVVSLLSVRPGSSVEFVPYVGLGGGYMVMTYGSVDVGTGWAHGALGAQVRLPGPFTLWAQLLLVRPFGSLARPGQELYPVLELGVLFDLT